MADPFVNNLTGICPQCGAETTTAWRERYSHATTSGWQCNRCGHRWTYAEEIERLRVTTDRLRGYARRYLLAEMHDICEASSCAQWLGDWGVDLWRWLLDPTLAVAAWGGDLDDYTDRDALIRLIRDADGWWSTADTFVDLAAWEASHGRLPAAAEPNTLED